MMDRLTYEAYNCTVQVQMMGSSKHCSGFTIDKNDRQYLVTARHHIGVQNVGPIDLEVKISSSSHVLKGLLPSNAAPVNSDIVVFLLEDQLNQPLPIVSNQTGMQFSQSCFFIGYPMGLGTSVDIDGVANIYALTKRGIISGQGSVNGVHTVFLDGHNNPGFSGGPWFFYDSESVLHIGGVVVSYRHSGLPVLDSDGKNTEMYVEENTGIIFTQSIQDVLDQIDLL